MFGVEDGVPCVGDTARPCQLLQMVSDALKCARCDLWRNRSQINMVRFAGVIQREDNRDDREVTGLRDPLIEQVCFVVFRKRRSSRLGRWIPLGRWG
jgi:hypothetical protein